MTMNLNNSYQNVCGVVMADGDGGDKQSNHVYDLHTKAIFYKVTTIKNPDEKDKEDIFYQYWVHLKGGELVEFCDTDIEKMIFSNESNQKIPIVRVRDKPFLPSGDLVRA